jgi:SAM-dependent methyltransferase
MQDKNAEQVFFDAFAQEQAYDVLDDRGYKRLLREFAALVRPSPAESLLDIGCGSGAFAEQLRFSGLRITGIDLSFNNVRLASEKSKDSSFAVADAETLPFGDNEFDIVTFSGVLHHLPVLDKTLSETHRILKPGGRIFAYDPNGRNPAMWLYRSPRSPLHSREGWTVNERLLFSEEIEGAFRAAGFHDARSRGVSGIGFTYVKSRLVRTLLPVYNFLDGLLDKTPLGHRMGVFLVSYAQKSRTNPDAGCRQASPTDRMPRRGSS